MKELNSDQVFYAFTPALKPLLHVAQGEPFALDTLPLGAYAPVRIYRHNCVHAIIPFCMCEICGKRYGRFS